jgi:peptide/nickel transport system substrate-binding protein
MKHKQYFLVGVALVAMILAGYLSVGAGGTGQARAQSDPPVELASLTEDAYLQPAPHPILNDVKLRMAVAYCTNKDALVQAAYPELDPAERALLIADTFIPQDSWAYSTPATVYPYDPDAGRQLLEDNDWTLPVGEDIRMKDGKQFALVLRTTDSALRLAYMPIFEEQMLECGIRIIRSHEPGLTWLSWRDFELTGFAWGYDPEEDEPGGSELYACDQIPSPENGWSGSNFMGWCDPAASEAITLASDTEVPQEDRLDDYETFIDIFAEQVPSIPLFWRAPGESEYDFFEHIDFNLTTYLQLVDVSPDADAILEYNHYFWTEGTVDIRAGTVSEPVSIGYYPQVNTFNPIPEHKVTIDSFRLEAYKEGVLEEDFEFSGPIKISIEYPPVIGMQCQGCVDETTVALYVWRDETWKKASDSCPAMIYYENLDIPNNLYEVNICGHLSEFMMMGDPVFWNFLPYMARK